MVRATRSQVISIARNHLALPKSCISKFLASSFFSFVILCFVPNTNKLSTYTTSEVITVSDIETGVIPRLDISDQFDVGSQGAIPLKACLFKPIQCLL